MNWPDLFKQSEHRASAQPNSLVIQWAENALRLSEKPTLLDVGCGMGKDALALAERGATVHACDYSIEMVEMLTQENRGRLASVRQCSADDLSLYQDAMFDGVISYGVLFYLSRAGIAAAMREIARVLKPSGAFFSTFSTPENKLNREPYLEAGLPLVFLTATEICHFAEDAGLRIVTLIRYPEEDRIKRLKQDWYVSISKPLR